MKTTINAEVTFDDWEDEVPGIKQAIINQATDRLVEKLTPKIEKQIATQVDARMMALLDSVFDRQVQQTNTWGEPTGEPVTLRELLQRNAEEWFTERVNSRGDVPGYHDRDNSTRFEYLVKQVYEKDLKSLFTGKVKLAVKEIEGKMGEKIEADIRRYLHGVAAAV